MAGLPSSANTGPRRILLATDFSRGARSALRRVLRLPLAADATLCLLHVLPEPGWRSRRIDGFLRRSARQALTGLEARVARAARRALPGVRVTTALVQGRPAPAIARRARTMKADLIVLGRHGQRGFRRLLIGSTAQRVARDSRVPVLIVHRPPAGPYRRPLVALDDSPAARRAFRVMLGILDARARSVHVARAFDLPRAETLHRAGASTAEIHRYASECRERARRDTGRFLAAHCPTRLACHLHVRAGPARQVVLGEADRRRTDLVALGTRGRAGVRSAGIGGVAEAVIQHARTDVLVAPARSPSAARR